MQDENNDTVLVKLKSSMQPSIVMLTGNVKQAPEPMNNEMIRVDGYYGGYNQALIDCGVIEDDSN